MTLHEYVVERIFMAFEEKDLLLIDEDLMKITKYIADDLVDKGLDFTLISELAIDIMPGIIHVEAGTYDWQFDFNGSYLGSGLFANTSVEFITAG